MQLSEQLLGQVTEYDLYETEMRAAQGIPTWTKNGKLLVGQGTFNDSPHGLGSSKNSISAQI